MDEVVPARAAEVGLPRPARVPPLVQVAVGDDGVKRVPHQQDGRVVQLLHSNILCRFSAIIHFTVFSVPYGVSGVCGLQSGRVSSLSVPDRHPNTNFSKCAAKMSLL